MCAKSAIISNYEMKFYYLKRTGEGKNKMCTINIIRNKLLSRIFAVVKRKTHMWILQNLQRKEFETNLFYP
ncbi:hypothetical protein MNBD_BACTEROID03-1306 [hydrothermal vent metagenome]|uniref:Mobile element protein n=1 Tax=hydrothermal vent metagenome TaxID=652676 RepID=A0A3B0UFU9_9ZZZZ